MNEDDVEDPNQIAGFPADSAPDSPVAAVPAERVGPVAFVYPSAPLLSKSRPSPTLPELRQKISSWLSSELQAGPSSGVNKMGDFLVSCARTKGMTSREVAIGGLRWWLWKLREAFGEEAEARAKERGMKGTEAKEFWEEDEEDGSETAEKMWFDAFASVKSRVDDVYRERYGRGVKL